MKITTAEFLHNKVVGLFLFLLCFCVQISSMPFKNEGSGFPKGVRMMIPCDMDMNLNVEENFKPFHHSKDTDDDRLLFDLEDESFEKVPLNFPTSEEYNRLFENSAEQYTDLSSNNAFERDSIEPYADTHLKPFNWLHRLFSSSGEDIDKSVTSFRQTGRPFSSTQTPEHEINSQEISHHAHIDQSTARDIVSVVHSHSFEEAGDVNTSSEKKSSQNYHHSFHDAAANIFGNSKEVSTQNMTRILDTKPTEVSTQNMTRILDTKPTEISTQNMTEILGTKPTEVSTQNMTEILDTKPTEVSTQNMTRILYTKLTENSTQNITKILDTKLTEVSTQNVIRILDTNPTEVSTQNLTRILDTKLTEVFTQNLTKILDTNPTEAALEPANKLPDRLMSIFENSKENGLSTLDVSDSSQIKSGDAEYMLSNEIVHDSLGRRITAFNGNSQQIEDMKAFVETPRRNMGYVTAMPLVESRDAQDSNTNSTSIEKINLQELIFVDNNVKEVEEKAINHAPGSSSSKSDVDSHSVGVTGEPAETQPSVNVQEIIEGVENAVSPILQHEEQPQGDIFGGIPCRVGFSMDQKGMCRRVLGITRTSRTPRTSWLDAYYRPNRRRRLSTSLVAGKTSHRHVATLPTWHRRHSIYP